MDRTDLASSAQDRSISTLRWRLDRLLRTKLVAKSSVESPARLLSVGHANILTHVGSTGTGRTLSGLISGHCNHPAPKRYTKEYTPVGSFEQSDTTGSPTHRRRHDDFRLSGWLLRKRAAARSGRASGFADHPSSLGSCQTVRGRARTSGGNTCRGIQRARRGGLHLNSEVSSSSLYLFRSDRNGG